MKALLVKDNGNQLTIKINKSDFDSNFLGNIVKQIELEQLVHKADIDSSVIPFFKNELSLSFVKNQEQYYKPKSE
jgi:hypothetical protein